jgi:hypothetical protein
MQPYLFLYLGTFQMMSAVDSWVVFDEIQYIRKGWVNRTRILHRDQDWQFTTIPVQKAPRETNISEIQVAPNIDWRASMTGNLSAYRREAPFYQETVELVQRWFEMKETSLSRLVVGALKITSEYLRIPTPIGIQSELGLDLGPISHPGQWALRIAQKLDADAYINPIGGVHLFSSAEFDNAGINLRFFRPSLPAYSRGAAGFMSGLSILDVLMWNSREKVQEWLQLGDSDLLHGSV